MNTFGQGPCPTCHTFITSADPTYRFSSGYIIKISNNIDVMLKSNNTRGCRIAPCTWPFSIALPRTIIWDDMCNTLH